jgi:acyl carrier protein phosphodiesterase
MNYLAHAYLSFNHPEILVGNIISDFVKGKKKFDYPPGIQNGIALHRTLDGFTDSHPATREAKNYFRPYYRLYSGAFVDVLYDHFLAADENEFSEKTLFEFSEQVYTVLEKHSQWLPPRFTSMFYYMKTQNWLYHYRSIAGAEKGFGGLVRRSAYLTESDTACRVFQVHYRQLQNCFTAFWKDVKPFAKVQFQLLAGLYL